MTVRDLLPWFCLCLALSGCSAEDLVPPTPERLEPLEPIELVADGRLTTYRVAWSWEGATREDDAYHFTSTEGVEVWLESIEITNASMELLPCVAEETALLPSPLDFFRPKTARADHGGISDVSLFERIFVQSGDAEEELYGQPTLERGVIYCELFRLLRAESPGPSGVRETLKARGRYSLPDSDAVTHFDFAIELDHGAATTLATRGTPSSSDALEIVVVQRGRELFDGIDDLADLSERELAFELLRNAARYVDVEIRRPD